MHHCPLLVAARRHDQGALCLLRRVTCGPRGHRLRTPPLPSRSAFPFDVLHHMRPKRCTPPARSHPTLTLHSTFCPRAQLNQVNNSGIIGSPDGKLSAAVGKAKQVSGAKLEVSFFGPFFAPYWVCFLAAFQPAFVSPILFLLPTSCLPSVTYPLTQADHRCRSLTCMVRPRLATPSPWSGLARQPPKPCGSFLAR